MEAWIVLALAMCGWGDGSGGSANSVQGVRKDPFFLSPGFGHLFTSFTFDRYSRVDFVSCSLAAVCFPSARPRNKTSAQFFFRFIFLFSFSSSLLPVYWGAFRL